MAKSTEKAATAGAVLIAGAGHARRDRGATLYLSDATPDALLVVAFIDVEPDRTDAGSRSIKNAATSYDLIWFTPRAAREDPCAGS